MFIARRPGNLRRGSEGAEPNLTSTYLVSFRPSEPRLVVVRFRSINISLLRSEEISFSPGFMSDMLLACR